MITNYVIYSWLVVQIKKINQISKHHLNIYYSLIFSKFLYYLHLRKLLFNK